MRFLYPFLYPFFPKLRYQIACRIFFAINFGKKGYKKGYKKRRSFSMNARLTFLCKEGIQKATINGINFGLNPLLYF